MRYDEISAQKFEEKSKKHPKTAENGPKWPKLSTAGEKKGHFGQKKFKFAKPHLHYVKCPNFLPKS